MKVKTVAIIEIILGAVVIVSFMCPSMWSNIVLGALVLVLGMVLLVKPR